MSELKIKLELNKGRVGVPLEQLARVARESRRFFEMFARDVDLGEGEWIAQRFTNGSLGYDNTFRGETTDRALAVANRAFRHLMKPERTPEDLGFGIQPETFFQFGKIAASLPPNEVLFIGVYDGEPEPEMQALSRERFLEIEQQIVQRTTHYGGLQGAIIALFKGSNTIWVHDRSRQAKVVCEFTDNDYGQIWELLKSQDAIVSVEGWITKRPGKDDHLKIQTIGPAAEYQTGDLEKFFGLDPQFTGDMSTDDYLDDLRGDTSEDYLKRLSK